jgi:hypothetical protein
MRPGAREVSVLALIVGDAGADQPLVLGRVSSLKLEAVAGGTDEGADLGLLGAGAKSLRGSGVLQTVHTTVPGGLVNPQCGHSVDDGMTCLVQGTIHDSYGSFKLKLAQRAWNVEQRPRAGGYGENW